MKRAKFLIYLGAVLTLAVTPAHSDGFVFDEKLNQEMASRLNIPVYFTVPISAHGTLPQKVETTDKLIDFRHPDAKGAPAYVGLRLVVAKRAGLAQRLGRIGLVQTGDLLLTFRPEWGKSGYLALLMGISHTGLAYIKDGTVHNLDNPLNEEYLGARGRLDSEHYRTLSFFHVVRPRLSDAQRAHLLEWAIRLAAGAKRIYPRQISFNLDFNSPKYKRGTPLHFVKHLGQAALEQEPSGNVDMYDAEFIWALLALRDCDPVITADAFKSADVPPCVKPVMQPMRWTGDQLARRGRYSYAGLADGPLLVVDALRLPDADRNKMLQPIFVDNPGALARTSGGNRAMAQQFLMAPVQRYYSDDGGKLGLVFEKRMSGNAFDNTSTPENYTSTSFLINTLLPPSNANRTMDYIATVIIE